MNKPDESRSSDIDSGIFDSRYGEKEIGGTQQRSSPSPSPSPSSDEHIRTEEVLSSSTIKMEQVEEEELYSFMNNTLVWGDGTTTGRISCVHQQQEQAVINITTAPTDGAPTDGGIIPYVTTSNSESTITERKRKRDYDTTTTTTTTSVDNKKVSSETVYEDDKYDGANDNDQDADNDDEGILASSSSKKKIRHISCNYYGNTNITKVDDITATVPVSVANSETHEERQTRLKAEARAYALSDTSTSTSKSLTAVALPTLSPMIQRRANSAIPQDQHFYQLSSSSSSSSSTSSSKRQRSHACGGTGLGMIPVARSPLLHGRRIVSYNSSMIPIQHHPNSSHHPYPPPSSYPHQYHHYPPHSTSRSHPGMNHLHHQQHPQHYPHHYQEQQYNRHPNPSSIPPRIVTSASARQEQEQGQGQGQGGQASQQQVVTIGVGTVASSATTTTATKQVPISSFGMVPSEVSVYEGEDIDIGGTTHHGNDNNTKTFNIDPIPLNGHAAIMPLLTKQQSQTLAQSSQSQSSQLQLLQRIQHVEHQQQQRRHQYLQQLQHQQHQQQKEQLKLRVQHEQQQRVHQRQAQQQQQLDQRQQRLQQHLLPFLPVVDTIQKNILRPLFVIEKNYQHLFQSTTNVSRKLDLILTAVQDAKQQFANGAGKPPNGYRRWLYFVGEITQCLETCYGGCNHRFLFNRKKLLSSRYECPNKIKHKFIIKRPPRGNQI